MNFLRIRTLILLFLMVFVMAGSAVLAPTVQAQVSGPDKPVEGAVPGGTTAGDSSDSELWRAIRQGETGTVVGADKSGGLMIQSQGEDWRLIRNGPLPMYSAIAILGMLIVISVFFALRGRIKIDHGWSGKTITRFNGLERAAHWLLASSFIVLAITGLNLIFGKDLLLPVIGAGAFATITEFGKYIHNYVGFAFMASLVLVAALWVVHNFPNRHDLVWILRGGGLIGHGHPPARKFNAGQKILFWVIILCGISISLSGWALLNPFTTTMFADTAAVANSILGTNFATDLEPIHEQQLQTLWHAIMAVFMIVVVIGHIYIGTVGMEGAIAAVTSGEVDENWAKEHHSLWVEEVKAEQKSAGKSGGKQQAQPAE